MHLVRAINLWNRPLLAENIVVSSLNLFSLSDVNSLSAFANMFLVPTAIRFLLQSSSHFIKRHSISTKTEPLFLVHCIIKLYLILCIHYIWTELVSSEIRWSLAPCCCLPCLALTIVKPFNNVKFHIQRNNLHFLLSDFIGVSLFLLGMVKFTKYQSLINIKYVQ
jgi:hypothetical protein